MIKRSKESIKRWKDKTNQLEDKNCQNQSKWSKSFKINDENVEFCINFNIFNLI